VRVNTFVRQSLKCALMLTVLKSPMRTRHFRFQNRN
jgi:hypothetical protein